jgi:hypothetical protein
MGPPPPPPVTVKVRCSRIYQYRPDSFFQDLAFKQFGSRSFNAGWEIEFTNNFGGAIEFQIIDENDYKSSSEQ